MASKQTRRSISVTGELYARLKEYCEREGGTMSGTAEEVLRELLGMPSRQVTVSSSAEKGSAPVFPPAPDPDIFEPKERRPVSSFAEERPVPAEEVPSADPKVTPIDDAASRRRKLIQEVAESRVSVFTY